jgi:hypothetical protein
MLWQDFRRWIMKGDDRKLGEELKNNRNLHIELVVCFGVLEFYGALIPSEESYDIWIGIRNEVFDIIKVADEMIDAQAEVDKSLEQDQTLFVSLSTLLFLDKLDRELCLIDY